MARLIVIVGMGGSGKSTLCREIASSRKAIAFPDATLTNCDRRRAGYDCLGEIVARLLRCNQDCVMDESHLTVPEFRRIFREFCDHFLCGVEQEWIFFQKDLLGCINNIYRDSKNGRGELSRLESVLGQSKVYVLSEPGTFPGYQMPRPVFRPSSPQFDNEADALAWLQSEIARLKDKRV